MVKATSLNAWLRLERLIECVQVGTWVRPGLARGERLRASRRPGVPPLLRRRRKVAGPAGRSDRQPARDRTHSGTDRRSSKRCGVALRRADATGDRDAEMSTGSCAPVPITTSSTRHCSLFSTVAALDRALARAGFVATRLERVFDEQYLWAEACVAPDARASSPDAYHRRWDTTLARATEQGGVVVWGAGAKGANFVQLFDPGADRIAAVVDGHPAKAGPIPAAGPATRSSRLRRPPR